jgi:hypothetical protein
MRSFPGTASRALIFVLAALFAGCSSTSQGTQALPGGSTSQSMARAPGVLPFITKGPHSRMELLKLQAEGKLAGPVPRKALLREIKLLQSHSRPHFSVRHDSGVVGLWATVPGYDYLIGFNNRVKKVLTDIDTADNGCYEPITVKVDSSQNIWTACEYNSSFSEALVQEYTSAGAFKDTYTQGCPASVSDCTWEFSDGFDSAANSSDVFSALDFYEYEVCNPSCTFYDGAGFEYWPAGDPSATPTLISLGTDCDPICDVYYMDVDNSGNIWFDYYGEDTTNDEFGYGLAEVENPTTSPTLVNILPVGSLGFPGGVYVSNSGSVLNVTDQDARTTKQYDLPLSPSGSPFNTLGPTPENLFGLGDPVSGGFNKTDTKMALGDAYGWLDKGTVSTNKWKLVSSPDLSEPEGAAYTPSDK